MEHRQLNREDTMKKQVEDNTLSGYQEWKILKELEADKLSMSLAIAGLIVFNAGYAMMITTCGLLLQSQTLTSSLHSIDP